MGGGKETNWVRSGKARFKDRNDEALLGGTRNRFELPASRCGLSALIAPHTYCSARGKC